jgi:hypothetical protein
MRRWEAILLAAALVCGSSALAQEDFGKKIASPEEYNAGRQQSTIYLARGVTLELRFGCGRAEIDGEMRPQPDQAEWPQLQAWILEQIEREHPLGRKLRSNLDPIEALMILNGRSPAVDEYEHGYFQTIYAWALQPDGTRAENPTIESFTIHYAHTVTGKVLRLQRRQPPSSTAPNDKGEYSVSFGVEVSTVTLDTGTYFVTEAEADRLKEGETFTFEAFGPFEFIVV